MSIKFVLFSHQQKQVHGKVLWYNHKITKFQHPWKLIQKKYANVYIRKSPRKLISMWIFFKQILETTRLTAYLEILFFKTDEQKRESEF